MSEMVVFGYVPENESDAARERMVSFAVALAQRSGLAVATCRAHNYTELAELVHKEKVDFGWLPPIPYLALTRHGRVVPLASARSAGRAEFYSVLVVRRGSSIANPRDLPGKRAAWVDPHSASGYVLPRIALAAVGVDPRTAFSTEKFYTTHDAALRAVLDESADVAATFAWLDASGNIGRSVWLDIPGAQQALRVLATFGAIPAGVIAARTNLDERIRERIADAVLEVAKDDSMRPLLRDLFSADDLRRGPSPGYTEFSAAVTRASSAGLLEGEEKG